MVAYVRRCPLSESIPAQTIAHRPVSTWWAIFGERSVSATPVSTMCAAVTALTESVPTPPPHDGRDPLLHRDSGGSVRYHRLIPGPHRRAHGRALVVAENHDQRYGEGIDCVLHSGQNTGVDHVAPGADLEQGAPSSGRRPSHCRPVSPRTGIPRQSGCGRSDCGGGLRPVRRRARFRHAAGARHSSGRT